MKKIERDNRAEDIFSEADLIATLTAERDAAICERDKLRGEITSVLDRSEFTSTELTRLRNRVAELEQQATSLKRSLKEIVVGFGEARAESHRLRIIIFAEESAPAATVAAEADRITQALIADRFAAAVAEADTLRARVASLEQQLDSVACRAATAYVSGIDVSHWQPLPLGPEANG